MNLSPIAAVLLVLSAPLAGASRPDRILRLATTTSTYDSGLLDVLVPPFEKQQHATVHVISVGTGKALRLGENGDVDLVLVHARAAEDRFVKAGHGVDRRDVMFNDFVVLGPVEDPAQVNGLDDVADALRRIHAQAATFVSRGDESGTHLKEKLLWANAECVPGGKAYLETGQGMSATLTIADEKHAYVLADRATYLSRRKALRIVPLVEGDPDLHNPYGVIAINPRRHKHIDHELARLFIEWLVSPECRRLIRSYRKHGQILFVPAVTGRVHQAHAPQAHE